MKNLRPGQVCTINNRVYRAKKRIDGCHGCSLNNFFTCPEIVDSRNGKKPLNCDINNIILVRI